MDAETAEFNKAPGLLVTKFDRPAPTPHHVTRERVAALFPDVPRAVTAIIAPAGYGKTTALARWVSTLEINTAWLRLDQADRDPARFGSHLAEAVNQSSHGALPSVVSAALGATGTVGGASRVTPLLNYVAGRDRPFHVVLDDYHHAASPDVDEVVRYLLTHAPRTLRLCLTSRSQPDLQLTRLRGAGDLTELTADELAFDAAETSQVLNRIAGINVTVDEAAHVHQATEGWPVMVALIAHAIAARRDTALSQILQDAERELDSYVLEEVLASCDVDEIDFVRATSILDQVTGPLADVICEQPGSGARLAELARLGFPLERFESGGPWYRFHQHVAQTLREQLANSMSAAGIRDLHCRAAIWLEEADDTEASLDHALLGGDYERAARLFDRWWLGLVNRGQVQAVRGWLSRMPRETVAGDPALALATAWTNLMAGELDTVSSFLASARSFVGDEPTLPGASSVASGVALIETLYYRMAGRLTNACDSAEVALGYETEPDATGRARALAYAGVCRFWKGQFDHASRLLNHAVGVGDRFGQSMARLLALGYLGLIEAEHDSNEGLRSIVADAEALIDEAGLHFHPTAAPALTASAFLAAAEGRHDEALTKLEAALAVASIQAEPGLLAYVNVACAQLLDKLGRDEEAERRRLLADGLCRRAEDVGFIASRCGTHSGAQVAPDVSLTGREISVLELLSSSLSLPEIAAELFVSHNTVKTHVQSLYRKLGVSKREDAVRVAAALGAS